MALLQIEVDSFRAFRDKAKFGISPLTLLYGFNQAGKSTLLRLLPFLADSIHGQAGAVDLTSPALSSARFDELGWLGKDPSYTPQIGIEVNGASLVLQMRNENGLIVNRVQIHQGNEPLFDVRWDQTISRDKDRTQALYLPALYKDQPWENQLTFDSFFPVGLPAGLEEIIAPIKQACQALKRVQWLRANRISLQADNGGRKIRCAQADGSDLAEQLAQYPATQILQPVSSWLAEQEGLGQELLLDQNRQFALRSQQRPNALPLRLAGEGLRALLPIILCAAWAETKDLRAPTILAVEEPEAHLHPHLQVALFDRLIDTVNAGIPIVLETHSVYLLRAMQLAILDGRLTPQDVGLYWIDQTMADAPDPGNGVARLTPIGIDADATLSGWRPDLFEKEQQLGQAILARRWRMGATP